MKKVILSSIYGKFGNQSDVKIVDVNELYPFEERTTEEVELLDNGE